MIGARLMHVPRRIVRAGSAWILAGALIGAQATAAEKVETSHAILSLKAGSGDLIGLQWKRPRLQIIAEGKLGENFRILLPWPDYEANYFHSREQVLRKLERLPDGVKLHYGPLKNAREEIDVHVTYEI